MRTLEQDPIDMSARRKQGIHEHVTSRRDQAQQEEVFKRRNYLWCLEMKDWYCEDTYHGTKKAV